MVLLSFSYVQRLNCHHCNNNVTNIHSSEAKTVIILDFAVLDESTKS